VMRAKTNSSPSSAGEAEETSPLTLFQESLRYWLSSTCHKFPGLRQELPALVVFSENSETSARWDFSTAACGGFTLGGMKARTPKDCYLEINGLQLHYLQWGDGSCQPMVLLHGFMAHAHVWDEFAARFSDRYCILALDQRGHGESQWSKELAYTIDDHFADIAGFIKILRLQRVILVGHSMGGRNALFFTACAPDKVEKLIVVDARPGTSAEASQALRELLSRFPLEARSLDEVVEAILGLHPYLEKDRAFHIARHGFSQVNDTTFLPRYDVRMAHLSDRSAGSIENLWAYLPTMTCPTLIIRGKESPFLSRQDAEEMCKLIPQAEYREIPDSTHMPIQENPVDAFKVIADFLEGRR